MTGKLHRVSWWTSGGRQSLLLLPLAGLLVLLSDPQPAAPKRPAAGDNAPLSPSPTLVLQPSRLIVDPAQDIHSDHVAPPVADRHRLQLDPRVQSLLARAGTDTDAMAFEAYLVHWTAQFDSGEIRRILASLQQAGLTQEFESDVTIRLVRHWTGNDMPGALAWVQALPAGSQRDLGLENIAILSSERDLATAAAWATRLASGPDQDRILAAVANEAIRQQPAEALRLAANLPATPVNDDLIRRAAMEWTSQDQPGALAWAREIPDPAFRAQVLAGVAVAWGDHDPIAAGRMALAEVPAGRQLDDALVGIAQRWAEHAPEAAARWIAAFPEGDLKQAAADSVAAIWAQHQPEIAARWKVSLAASTF